MTTLMPTGVEHRDKVLQSVLDSRDDYVDADRR